MRTEHGEPGATGQIAPRRRRSLCAEPGDAVPLWDARTSPRTPARSGSRRASSRKGTPEPLRAHPFPAQSWPGALRAEPAYGGPTVTDRDSTPPTGRKGKTRVSAQEEQGKKRFQQQSLCLLTDGAGGAPAGEAGPRGLRAPRCLTTRPTSAEGPARPAAPDALRGRVSPTWRPPLVPGTSSGRHGGREKARASAHLPSRR